ncbi:Oidioi.mRNA.OKI2018_I69.XSR.g15887.t1.cds [Oikopleura dioica]|uniref:Oidioi.mRNA.OKI2018_I69.XSR.g15887.t1.cds n=1 Tax=Oikopleura dioica TaxID=34765 RepID=A0ABN7SJA4_OIKDI|nr:Oidioi.mRNA.OKI2018_I69.XSR.g15887.t1.cds [Oikopleura dioica]
MKLRSRKIDNDGASTSASKIAKRESFESLFPGMLVSFGKYGECVGSECDGVPTKIWPIRGRNLCEICATKEYGSNFFRTERTHVVLSDAKFKCPAYDKEGSCKSKDVCFKGFFMGSCCEPASKVLFENEKAQEKQLKVVHYYYNEEYKYLNDYKNECEKAKSTVTTTEQTIKRDEEALKKLKKKVEEAEKSLEEKKKDLKDEQEDYEAEKKLLIDQEKEKKDALKRFRQISYEYHSVAAKFSFDDEVEAKENRKDNQYCKFCNEDYNDTHRRKSFLPSCGHVACRDCFRNADEEDGVKICPVHWTTGCFNRYFDYNVCTLYE